MEDYDVIIVGGGPGGSTCAANLGKAGHKVLLLDKARFPRDKVCGDGITGKSRGFIQKLGLLDEMEERGAIYDGIEVIWPKGSKTLIKAGDGYYSYVCKRQIFDNVLFQNAKKLSDAREGFAVTDVIAEGGKVVGVKATDLSDSSTHEFRAKVVVGADGANSVVATKLGLPVVQTAAGNVQQLVSKIRADHSGQVVLVVGHSNTVPDIIEAFGGGIVPAVPENEFDNLYVVTLIDTARVSVLRMKFGARE
jgi:flavin-dependent dehydrogenase